LLNQKTSKNSPSGGGIGDLCRGGGGGEEAEEEEAEEEEAEEEEEDSTELGEVQELGTEILEMILDQVFGAEDLEP
jgi:hypothetical protein